MLWESPAVAKAAMETGAARRTIDLDEYREQLAFRQGMGEQVRYFIMNKARASAPKKRIVFAEGEETKIIRAAAQVADEGIGIPILIGRPMKSAKGSLQLGPGLLSRDRQPKAILSRLDEYAQAYYELRQRKGVTLKDAIKLVRDPNIFGPMMVKMGDADAFVSGLTYDYPEVIRPALQIHHTSSRGAPGGGCVYHDRQRPHLSVYRCHGEHRPHRRRTWLKLPAWQPILPASWAWSRGWRCCLSPISAAPRTRSRTRSARPSS